MCTRSPEWQFCQSGPREQRTKQPARDRPYHIRQRMRLPSDWNTNESIDDESEGAEQRQAEGTTEAGTAHDEPCGDRAITQNFHCSHLRDCFDAVEMGLQ